MLAPESEAPTPEEAFNAHLREVIDAALIATGKSARAVSMEIVGHDGLIRDIRRGNVPTADKLAALAMDGNKDKITSAPVVAIIGYDIDFHEELPWLFPHTDAKSWFDGDEEGRKEGAFRNSSLQGAYLIIAARALGLDCGPMSGFDNDAVDKAFFADEPRHRSNFICAIGYGDRESIFARSPRPDFDKFNRID